MKRFLIITLICLCSGVLHSQETNGTGDASVSPDATPVEMTRPTAETAPTADSEDELTLPATATPSQKEKAEELHRKDGLGGALTLMSMGIVVIALAVLSVLFLLFGKISASLQKRRKHRTARVAAAHIDGVDSGEAIAAIGAAMAEHFSDKHDMEDTILTIKRMRRAYSPWNSKIYNIRLAPQVHKP